YQSSLFLELVFDFPFFFCPMGMGYRPAVAGFLRWIIDGHFTVKVHIDRELEGLELVWGWRRQCPAGVEYHDHLIAIWKGEEIGDAGFQHLQVHRIGVIRALESCGQEE